MYKESFTNKKISCIFKFVCTSIGHISVFYVCWEEKYIIFTLLADITLLAVIP